MDGEPWVVCEEGDEALANSACSTKHAHFNLFLLQYSMQIGHGECSGALLALESGSMGAGEVVDLAHTSVECSVRISEEMMR